MTAAGVARYAATARLEAARLPSPAADARVLLAHVCGVDLGRLALVGELTADQEAAYAELIERRVAGVPVQHLTGEAWFRNVRVAVGPGVFIPRPETEVMTGWGIDAVAHLQTPRIVELCAGSGAISLALADEIPGAEIHAVELSEEAAAYTARNLAGSGVELVIGDMAHAFGELDGTVDLVIANPPYIPLDRFEDVALEVRTHDPALALFSGDDGLDAMRVVAQVAHRLLRPQGVVATEHAEVQEHSAPEVFVAHGGFDRVRDHRDLTDRPRFVTAVRR